MKLLIDIKKSLPGFELNVKFNSSCKTLGILGASGSGKSMTLRCIAGLITPDCGKIVLNDRVLFDSSKNINLPIQERNIGFLFQNYALFPHMNVEDNIAYALNKLNKARKAEIIEYFLDIMQIKALRKRYPSQLSGGQQQRVAIARALAVNPDALLLDEPFSALDNHLRNLMVKSMVDTLSKFKGITLFVTHNMDEAYQISEDIIVLEKGEMKGYDSKYNIFLKPPSKAAARITGCKNISAAKKVDMHTIEAIDWGCKIILNKPINGDLNYIGIRAHYIHLSEANKENTFNAWPTELTETPFRKFVFLKLHKPPIDSSDYNLLWDISTEEWDKIQKMPLPWSITFNLDKIILINEKEQE
ncbi:sulfate/molybdate ABC transporter ATP-binding protein [Clostridium sp. 19966]|uniref:sulfate/molybdate ABC transporter ATP-binding protein n=1 Tax=Clostridium sp. 19966 TaxID=2768166 RepID=UPI0028DE21EC|nr:sulfate/molybdate ABC transporter ATP-binding protein [Clostridium sp. 19966]MDT8717418.1 sulfate/molybdate ABC transporter ATP-binding protein [Clostridium sp. 19966]